ncbi:hypothetical protein E1A91_A09G258000v1 [Gossypium mustelinum]|uniref:Uncharacterized protein n=1 Tax=Gossypium mustelinum TaxID=34275 RepID=A0A5D2Y2A4_GOSMU|nr:hypothetical protein E1A91_A09G258000v1 [Gossypium mustelinum]
MEGIINGGKVGEGEDIRDNNNIQHCINHPYGKNPGGICAFCLQEKLGKLVSSSSPLPIHGSSSSSSSSPSPPPLRSAAGGGGGNGGVVGSDNGHYRHTRRAASADGGGGLKRSKSTVTPRGGRFVEGGDEFRKRSGFWSFLYVSSKTHSAQKPASIGMKLAKKGSSSLSMDDDHASSFERKVSRSRSVGCGSRSFSGDFFERISTGFGDCTLRRVESQREGKSKPTHHHGHAPSSSSGMKERVKCGGIFSGFMIMTSSSSTSSSSSSSYWVSSAPNNEDHINGRNNNKSWGWAFASPIRAFTTSKPPPSGKKHSSIVKESTNNDNTTTTTTPNLSAIPSLLAVTS